MTVFVQRRSFPHRILRLSIFLAALLVHQPEVSFGADLRVTNKTLDDSAAVRKCKLFLIDASGIRRDSLISNDSGAVTFRNVSVGVAEGTQAPNEFRVYQNYPNPFNPSTNIDVEVAEQTPLRCDIYSVNGQLIKKFDALGEPGQYTIEWHGDNDNGATVANGVYFARIATPKSAKTVKMVNFGGFGQSKIYQKSGSLWVPNSAGNNGSKNNGSNIQGDAPTAMYRLAFENTDSTSPRIVPWSTGLFPVSGDMDTTLYSNRDVVAVRGNIYDALTMNNVGNARVRANYLNANRRDSVLTDAAGNFSIRFERMPADTQKFIIDVSKNGWYSCRARRSTTTRAVEDTLPIFRIFVDSTNIGSPDPRKDGLEWLKWMHFGVFTRDTSYIAHWRPQDMPLRVYLDSLVSTPHPTQKSLDTTRFAINLTNAQLGTVLQEVPQMPDTGTNIAYGLSGNSCGIGFARDPPPAYIPLYPISGGVSLQVTPQGDPAFSYYMAMHEIGHILLTTGQHGLVPFLVELPMAMLSKG